MNVIAYIDGLNLYHAINKFGMPRLKWCDLNGLANHFLAPGDKLREVRFYTAQPTHLDAGVQRRFKDYIRALEATKVTVALGKFTKKENKVPIDKIKPPLIVRGDRRTNIHYRSYEEKGTDVHLAIDLVGDAYENRYDKALVVSRDYDILPGVEYVLNKFASKIIVLAYPPSNERQWRLDPNPYGERRKLRHIDIKDVAANLLPYELIGKDGAPVKIPPEYLQSRAD